MINRMEKRRYRFDASSHSYYLVRGGKEFRVPSVSEILSAVGFVNKKYFKPEDSERGILIHRIARWIEKYEDIRENLEYYLEGIQKENQEWIASGDLYGWANSWKRFLKESGWESETIERVRIHSTELFAGRVDRTGYIRNPKIAKKHYIETDDLVVLDLKTGSYQDWHMLQLEAYRIMVREENPGRVVKKMAVYLRPNGRYTLKNFPGEIGNTWMKTVYAFYELVVPKGDP